MGYAKRVLEEQREREPVFDFHGDEWTPLTARNPHRCAHVECGGTIEVDERSHRRVDDGRMMHVACYELYDGFERAIGSDNT